MKFAFPLTAPAKPFLILSKCLMLSQRFKTIPHWLIAITALLTLSGLLLSWFVGSQLIAPFRVVIGPPPQDLNASEFSLSSDSGATISGWHSVPDECRGVVVLIHGIRASRLKMLDRSRLLHTAGYATVMIDLQAHGASTGDTITVGHLEREDVRAAVRYARQQHPQRPIGVIGVSLGGAATLLASPLDVDAVVLEAVFAEVSTAISNRVSARLGPLSPLPTALLLAQLKLRLGISPAELRPIDQIAQVGCPLLIMSGRDDLYTPVTETQQLFAAAAEPKQLVLIDNAAHVDLHRHAPHQYQQAVLDFFDQHLSQPEHSNGRQTP